MPDVGGDVVASWRDFLLKLGLLVLAGLWIYSPTYHGDWLWDDDQLLTNNLTVQHRVSPNPAVPEDSVATLRKLWTNPDAADYFPLSYTALWAQWPFFHVLVRQPDGSMTKAAWSTGYHVFTILCHIAGTLCFWRLLRVMKVPGAWLGAMLFAIHPVCVETVAWVSEVKNTLSQPLFLLACTAFVQFDDERDRGRAFGFYLLAVFLFLLTMFAKTAVVMFPFLILAYGWWKHGFSIDRRGLIAVLLAGATLALAVVPMMYWLVEMRSGRSTPALYRTCTRIAMLGPGSSIGLAMGLFWFREGAGDARKEGARTLERYLLLSLPFFWISAVLGLATCYFQWQKAIGQEAIPVGGILSRIAVAGMGSLFYLWKTIWPFNLLTIYPRWDVDPPRFWQFLPWPIMIAAGWWLWSRRGTAKSPTWQRHMIFVLVYFLLMLVPIIGIITISYMRITWVADHFLYTPMLGVIAAAAAGIATAYARIKPREQVLAQITGAVLLVVLGYASFRYAHAWADEESLWPHTIAGHPSPCPYPVCGCWQAHNRLGAKKFARGDVEGAHGHFMNSTRLRPDLGETHNNLGTTLSARAQMLAQQGDQEGARREMNAAIEQFAEASRVTPHIVAIRMNLANALATAGRFGEASDSFKELLASEPDNPAYLNNYGVTLYRQGLKEDAIKQFRRALEINPDFKPARDSLALALGGEPEKAAAAPPPGGRLELEPPISPTLNVAPMPR